MRNWASQVALKLCASEIIFFIRHVALFSLFTKWMNEWLNEWKNAWIHEWMNTWMNEWMHELMNEWMHEWLHESWMNDLMNEWLTDWLTEWMTCAFVTKGIKNNDDIIVTSMWCHSSDWKISSHNVMRRTDTSAPPAGPIPSILQIGSMGNMCYSKIKPSLS